MRSTTDRRFRSIKLLTARAQKRHFAENPDTVNDDWIAVRRLLDPVAVRIQSGFGTRGADKSIATGAMIAHGREFC